MRELMNKGWLVALALGLFVVSAAALPGCEKEESSPASAIENAAEEAGEAAEEAAEEVEEAAEEATDAAHDADDGHGH